VWPTLGVGDVETGAAAMRDSDSDCAEVPLGAAWKKRCFRELELARDGTEAEGEEVVGDFPGAGYLDAADGEQFSWMHLKTQVWPRLLLYESAEYADSPIPLDVVVAGAEVTAEAVCECVEFALFHADLVEGIAVFRASWAVCDV
jgi:hypothetical protein